MTQTPTTHLPELLCPAGDREKLQAACTYGADAVYFGGRGLNLRAGAAGFADSQLRWAFSHCREHGVKAYYTLNALPGEGLVAAVAERLEMLGEMAADGCGPDGIIVADTGVADMARRMVPGLPLHISTQANTMNSAAARFWAEHFGAARVNVAREVTRDGLEAMLLGFPGVEYEVFAHGAQCMAVSGRCLLSAYLSDRSGNEGRCAHPCRYDYRVLSMRVEEYKRQGEDCWDVAEYAADGEAYTRFFAPRDLCLIGEVPWLAERGVAALKLEGRTKSALYVAQAADVYRTALDDHARGEFRLPAYLEELSHAATRPMSTGFFGGQPRENLINPTGNRLRVMLRVVEEAGPGRFVVAVKNTLLQDASLELLVPGMKRIRIDARDYGLEDEHGFSIHEAHPGATVLLRCDVPDIRPGLYLREAART